MKKAITILTAAVFALGLAGAGMAQSVGKEAAKPAAKTETKVTQSQVAPKTGEHPSETAKPATKEASKPEAKEAAKPGVKEKGKKAAKTGKKAKKAADFPAPKPEKEGKKQ